MATSLLRKVPTRFRLVAFFVLGLGMLAAFIFFSFHHSAPTPSSATELLIQKVSAHMTLPSVPPSVRQVQEVELLQRENPLFYQQAQIGDWVLSFPTMIILYRASTDRIITTLPVLR